MCVQEVYSRALITISELKTQVEESRWEKMKAAVGEFVTCFLSGSMGLTTSPGALAVLSLVIIISMEVYVVGPSRAAKKRAEQAQAPPPPQAPSPPTHGDSQTPWATAP